MVNVELVLILAIWVACCCLNPVAYKDAKWYKYMVKFYGKREKRFALASQKRNLSFAAGTNRGDMSEGQYYPGDHLTSRSFIDNKRKTHAVLPALLIQYFTVVWPLLLLAVGVSLYIYMTGNCHFSRPKQYDLDDEPSDINSIRGWNVLIFSILTACLGKVWAHQFFRERRFNLASILMLVMILCNGVVLWAMGSTEACVGDTMNHRFWISFGLYLAYTVWLVLTFLISLRWWGVIGPVFNKNTESYNLYKHNKQCHKSNKKTKRYNQNYLAFYPQDASLHAAQFGDRETVHQTTNDFSVVNLG